MNKISISDLPKIRGEYRENYPLAKATWFGVGGNADVLFRPADEKDLSDFLKNKPKNIKAECFGVFSNIIIRDNGYRGVIIRLGREFANISVENENTIRCGAGVLDGNLARFAAEHSISGLEFFIGVPGTIGGAIAMNAGAYGTETKDVLVSAKAVDENGNITEITNQEFDFKYRSHSLGKKLIFTSAILKGVTGEKEKILEKMKDISSSREDTQPVRTKTGGSTFKNPEGSKKAWQLIDEAGCRGLKIGGAIVSEKHCNFLINEGTATASDLINLGEEVRKRVFEKTGIILEWEIKMIGD